MSYTTTVRSGSYANISVSTSGVVYSPTLSIESLLSTTAQQHVREIRDQTGLSTIQIIEQCLRLTVMAKRRHMRRKQERRNAT